MAGLFITFGLIVTVVIFKWLRVMSNAFETNCDMAGLVKIFQLSDEREACPSSM